jgi:modulator of FtsH protease
MSINLREILGDSRLPPRAAGALCMVVTPLVIAICLLIPSQSKTALGIELLGIGGAAAAVLPALNWPRHLGPARTPIQWLYGTGLPMTFVIVPTILAGAGVLISGLGGLYWLPIITLAALLGSLLQAWVLLIEILRLPCVT